MEAVQNRRENRRRALYDTVTFQWKICNRDGVYRCRASQPQSEFRLAENRDSVRLRQSGAPRIVSPPLPAVLPSRKFSSVKTGRLAPCPHFHDAASSGSTTRAAAFPASPIGAGQSCGRIRRRVLIALHPGSMRAPIAVGLRKSERVPRNNAQLSGRINPASTGVNSSA